MVLTESSGSENLKGRMLSWLIKSVRHHVRATIARRAPVNDTTSKVHNRWSTSRWSMKKSSIAILSSLLAAICMETSPNWGENGKRSHINLTLFNNSKGKTARRLRLLFARKYNLISKASIECSPLAVRIVKIAVKIFTISAPFFHWLEMRIRQMFPIAGSRSTGPIDSVCSKSRSIAIHFRHCGQKNFPSSRAEWRECK